MAETLSPRNRLLRTAWMPALASALAELLADPVERQRLAAGALSAAQGRYSWDRIGRDTAALYRRLLR